MKKDYYIMRKIFLSITLALATIAGVVAQSSQTPKRYVLYGVESNKEQYKSFFSTRAGVNFSSLVDEYYYSKAQTGFNAALLYNISLMSDAPLYLQSGIGVEMKGARNTNLLDNISRSKLKSYGIEVPIVVTYDMQLGQKTALVPEFGLYYSYVFCGSLEGEGEFFRPYQSQEIEIYEQGVVDSRLLHRNDFGLRIGLSMRYGKMLIGVAYDAGLINTFGKAFRDLGVTLMTGTWSLNLGYRFN